MFLPRPILLLLPVLLLGGLVPGARGICDRAIVSSCRVATPVSGSSRRLDHESQSSGNSSAIGRRAYNASIASSNAKRVNLDELRLEYNKFRILSQLRMNSDPDLSAYRLAHNATHIQANISAFKRLQQPSSANRYTNISTRQKRSPFACGQVKSDKDACCLESFYVNFTEIGWDRWILYPSGYYANYCRGQCDLSNARYYHSTLLSKFSAFIGLCCSPRQMAPLRLLYIDEDNKVLSKTMPNMIVEKCDCA